MKKINCFFLVVLMSLTALTACKPKTEEESESKAANSLAERRRNRPFGIIASARHNFLTLEFSTSAGMTFSERNSLKGILKASRDVLKAIKDKKISSDKVYDVFFTARGQSGLSLYFRFMEIVDNYPDLLELRGADKDLLDRPVLFDDKKNDMFSENRFGHISETGLELMYVASTAFAISTNVDAAIKLISGRSGNLHISEMRTFSKELRSRYVAPMLSYYSKNIARNNSLTMKRGVTDYNMNFYSDAWVADWMHSNISRF